MYILVVNRINTDIELVKVGILIPTRNRPTEIVRLLESLTHSTVKPSQIVIVSSGDDISEVLHQFIPSQTITYHHSSVSGQINQKKIGISLLDRNLEWVIFLDDDLLVAKKCIENALEGMANYSSQSNRKVIGVGLAIPPTSRMQLHKSATRLLGRAFLISDAKPGKVLKNGHASSYLESPSILGTEWLNGASMWRRIEIDEYGANLISTQYAACEDLIFSYPKNMHGDLIFVPSAKVDFQHKELTDFENFQVFKSAALWRLFFISTNQGFSRILFLYTQLGRLLYASFKTKDSRFTFFTKAMLFWLQLIYLSFAKAKLASALKSI